ncbi:MULTISPECIES: helix-turn-helix domain-containing protein [Nocardia]|uniref:helix-turn-helix domain-containing protein n=1 Tax=Nocardia TaxID=1817 RepID=UPI003CC7D575
MSTRPELWLEILQAPERHRLTVTEVCRRYRISRKTYYSYLARYRAQGVAGLVPRSRRPKRFPSRSSAAVEAAVVRIRLNRPQWGARRIRAELMRGSTSHVPAISTLHAISRRHGLVGAQPNTRCPRGFGNSTSSCTAGRGRSHRSPTWTTRRGRALFASTPTARSAAAKAKCRSAPSSSGRPCTRPNTRNRPRVPRPRTPTRTPARPEGHLPRQRQEIAWATTPEQDRLTRDTCLGRSLLRYLPGAELAHQISHFDTVTDGRSRYAPPLGPASPRALRRSRRR